MGKLYDSCLKKVRKKIEKNKIGKTYRCDSRGNPNPKGRKRCKTSEYKICSKLR